MTVGKDFLCRQEHQNNFGEDELHKLNEKLKSIIHFTTHILILIVLCVSSIMNIHGFMMATLTKVWVKVKL